jgi:GT2 family glycosyltransferase
MTMQHPLIFLRNLTNRLLKQSLLGQLLLRQRPLPAWRPIHLVTATRLTEAEFWTQSELGQCLRTPHYRPDVVVHIYFANRQGLATIYNQHIQRCAASDILLFAHDDVRFDDDNWPELVRAALGQFDIVGVAGNVRLQENQPAWLFKPTRTDNPVFVWDYGYLSGEVSHAVNMQRATQVYGHAPLACQALDGVFMALDCAYLKRARVRFDEQFAFHFYDLDFCRSAGRAGLSMGTWPIALTHMSAGAFGSPDWRRCWTLYQKKWNPREA